jgi:hypothetical protein
MSENQYDLLRQQDVNLREALRQEAVELPPMPDDLNDRVLQRIGSQQLQRAQRHTLLAALRLILTSAAVYLVGLFLWLQQEPTEPVRQADNGQPVQEAVVPCTEGTPDEIIMCYFEQRETRPNTYHLIRQMLYENKQ